MRPAAIYFQPSTENSIFSGPQTLNFGGKFFYEFIELELDIIQIKKTANQHFINNFFERKKNWLFFSRDLSYFVWNRIRLRGLFEQTLK